MGISPDTTEQVTAKRGIYYGPNVTVDTIAKRGGVMNSQDLRYLAFLVASHSGGEIMPSQLTGSLAKMAALDGDDPGISELIKRLDIDSVDGWQKDFSGIPDSERREAIDDFVEESLITMLRFQAELINPSN